MTRALWFGTGLIALGCGLVGLLLPLLPTVPFLLLAALCFARSSRRMHDWLIQHPTLGPPIANWRDHGAINTTAKRLATLSIAVGFGLSAAIGLPPVVLGLQAAVLAGVLGFIWTRPSR